MKKLLLILFIPLLLGCNQEDTPSIIDGQDKQTENLLSDSPSFSDPDLKMFIQYNDSLSQAAIEIMKADPTYGLPSRSFISKLINRVKVVVADVKGAFKGFVETKGNFQDRKDCAKICSEISSAGAVKQIMTDNQKAPYESTNYDVSVYRFAVYKQSDFATEKAHWKNATGLTIDSKYDSFHEIGQAHNIMLDMAATNGNINYGGIFSADLLETINSEEFQNIAMAGVDYYNGTSSESPYSIQVRAKPDPIMSLFLSAIDNDAYRLSNVNTVIKDYISMVEKSSGISNEDKEILISSMIVATYSNQLWIKYGVPEFSL